jgi:hypothetical protein
VSVARKNYKKRAQKRRLKSDKQATLSVITVRISDEEKERIDEIMKKGGIKRYSDVMKMAIKMVITSHSGL